MNSEEFSNFIRNGEICCRHMRQLVGQALFAERQRRRLRLTLVSDKTGLAERTIEEVELAKEKPHWGAVEILLDFYGKTMALRLEDAPTLGLRYGDIPTAETSAEAVE